MTPFDAGCGAKSLPPILWRPLPAFAADLPAGRKVGAARWWASTKSKKRSSASRPGPDVKVRCVTDLPAEAYGEVANAFKANPGGTGGIKPESIETAAGLAYYTVENGKDGTTSVRRYSMILPGPTFSGYIAVQVPENASRIYTDDAIRQMFASAVIRNEVPIEETVGLMPFKVSELSSFKNIRTLRRGALILSDGDEKPVSKQPFMIIGIVSATPGRLPSRKIAARRQRAVPRFPGCAPARITMSVRRCASRLCRR
jgi:hypothetical protein